MTWWQAAIVGAVAAGFLRLQGHLVRIQVENSLSNYKNLLKLQSEVRIGTMEREITVIRAQMEAVIAENKKATAELEEARRFYRDPPGIPL